MKNLTPTGQHAPQPRGDTPTARVLRRAAEAFRTGELTWGTDFFVHPDTGCRCALGGIAWAAARLDPADNLDGDGDPRFTGPAAEDAMNALTDYLVDVRGAGTAVTDGQPDPIETVGNWNDEDAHDVDTVIAALEAAADRSEAGAR